MIRLRYLINVQSAVVKCELHETNTNTLSATREHAVVGVIALLRRLCDTTWLKK